MTLLLGGCLATDETGVRLTKNDLPAVVNCGTWIESVVVSDADTGRPLWAAHAVDSGQGLDDVASVAVGSLPARTWVEDSPLELMPRPARWRFEVGALKDVVIVVADGTLKANRIYRPGGKSEPVSHFDDQTCSGIPISPGAVRITLAVVVAMTATALIVGRRWRRRQAVNAK